MKNSSFQDGFFLVEALVAVLILSIGLVVSMGVIAQALYLVKRSQETTNAILALEPMFYQLETGERLDLILYGGRETVGADYQLNIESEAAAKDFLTFRMLKAHFSWNTGKAYIDFETYLPEINL